MLIHTENIKAPPVRRDQREVGPLWPDVDVDPMLFYCWADVEDGGPKIKQQSLGHRLDFTGNLRYWEMLIILFNPLTAGASYIRVFIFY